MRTLTDLLFKLQKIKEGVVKKYMRNTYKIFQSDCSQLFGIQLFAQEEFYTFPCPAMKMYLPFRGTPTRDFPRLEIS